MGKIEFEAERKNYGSPLVVAFEEKNDTFADKCSVMLQRRRFEDKKYPKHVRVTVEWIYEED